MKNTLIVNLLASPGSGKTTASAGVFYQLKSLGYDVEMVDEVAKHFVYEERMQALKCQPYVSVTQMWHIERLIGKVDAVITDSPVLLAHIYGKLYNQDGKYPESFYTFIKDYHLKQNNLDIFIERAFAYDQNGRIQTEEESKLVSNNIEILLKELGQSYLKYKGDHKIVHKIVTEIEKRLTPNTQTTIISK